MEELAGSAFLREWHARYPGLASAAFGFGRIAGDGRSSYALLVDDAAALPDPKIIVDLACGDGYLTELLAERFLSAELIGADMTPEELALARERALPGNARFVEARAEALPFEDSSVDAVLCHMALMLFDDARRAIHEIARVLRPKGIFAAVLGPGPDSSELLARFGAFLRDAEAEESLPPLHAGDPSTFAAGSLRSLFAGEAWHDVRLEDVGLSLDGSDEQVRGSLLSMYNVARLSENGRTRLTQRLVSEMADRRKAGRSTECVLGLRHLTARRSSLR